MMTPNERKLRATLRKVIRWLERNRRIREREAAGYRGRFDGLADETAREAKNLIATAAQLRQVLKETSHA